MTDARSSAPRLAGPRRPALAAVLVVGAVVAWALALLPFGPCARAVGVALYCLVAALVVDGLGAHPHSRFGLGNTVTLVRAAAATLFAALAVQPQLLAGPAAWTALAAAILLLALDGLDGWAARREGQVSAYGARFDMETDALLILALAGLAAGLGKAGPWVLAIGLLRYGFVLAGWLAPRLARPLPPSERRRAVCGVQVAILALLLAPPLEPPLSAALAAIALAALVWSFAIDIARLLRPTR